MGLLIKLKDGDTLLKSLKFGNDRPGGGSSKQPYIQKSIENNPVASTGGSDFILRGGIKAPQRALEDVSRLAKYTTDGVKGLLYTAKENLLSRTSVKTEASKGIAYAGGALNAGVYTPLSTLAQAGVGFTGTRLNRMGIDPTGLIGDLSINKYEDIIKSQSDNRLVTLTQLIKDNEAQTNFNFIKGYNLNEPGNNIITYGGGPGSTLGVGQTKIKFADQRTGENNLNLRKFLNEGYDVFKDPRKGTRTFNTTKLLQGITSKPTYNLPDQSIWLNIGEEEIDILSFIPSSTISGSLYVESEESKNSRINRRKDEVYLELDKKQPNGDDTYIVSIDKKYKKSESKLNYPARIENRVNLGDPGREQGTWADDVTDKSQIIDKINGSPIYSTTGNNIGRNGKDYNDLIAFRIGVIDNADPNNTTYMNFRAYIDSFSDSYSSNWKDQSYMGRGEKFYKYEGFSRDISLAFTVVAQSQGEMNGMYQKLNYLASSLAPYYTGQGYMAGNLVKLTVGDYIYEQVGFISSITYDIPEESSWELSLTPGIEVADNEANPDELPLMIKVTGLKFTPIHQFRPEINKYSEKGEAIVENRFITEKIPFLQNWQSGLTNT
jgi:hypothetical protein